MSNSDHNLLTEASLSRLVSHIKNRAFGILSACRSERDSKTNNELSHTLKTDIRAAGYGFINVNGSYVENGGTPQETVVKEKSFLVIGHKDDDGSQLLSFLKKEGKKFDQESIFFKPLNNTHGYLHFTNDSDEVVDLGAFHPMKIGDYYTDMKGKNFSFISLNEEKTWLEKWREVVNQK